MQTFHAILLGIFICIALVACDSNETTPVNNKTSNPDNEFAIKFGGAAFGSESGNDVAIDENGNILVAGPIWLDAETLDMAVWRYGSDGVPDRSFGNNNNGYITHNNAAQGNGNDIANAIAIDSNGKIVVAGVSEYTTQSTGTAVFRIVVWRFNPDGSLDTTFNNQGFTVFQSDLSPIVRDLLIDYEDRILVAGGLYVSSANSFDAAVIRFLPDGSLDTGFAENGVFTHHNAALGANADIANSIAMDHSGNLFLSGSSDSPRFYSDLTIWKLTSDGQLDTSFSDNGYVTNTLAGVPEGDIVGNSIALDKSDNIVVTGFRSRTHTVHRTDADISFSARDMVVWRFLPDGTLDYNFNNSGFTVHDNAAGGSANDVGASVAIDSADKIIVVGYSERFDETASLMYGGSSMVIWQFNEDGSFDLDYNNSGFKTFDDSETGYESNRALSLVLDKDDYKVVAGESLKASSNNWDVALWRQK